MVRRVRCCFRIEAAVSGRRSAAGRNRGEGNFLIREIFVPLQGGDSDAAALAAAATLARVHGAHITALVTMEHPDPESPAGGRARQQPWLDAALAAAEAVAAAAHALLAPHRVASEVRVTEALLRHSDETAAVRARNADLSIIGGPAPGAADGRFHRTFQGLLLSSGRPVLVVPAGSQPPAGLQRVVVAWQPTREAARAVHDALPLLGQAAEVDLVMVGKTPGLPADPTGSAELGRHLARHGLSVRLTGLADDGPGIAASLLRHVRETQADLLVMGGNGHARWREPLLGRATREVLDGSRTAVFFSH